MSLEVQLDIHDLQVFKLLLLLDAAQERGQAFQVNAVPAQVEAQPLEFLLPEHIPEEL